MNDDKEDDFWNALGGRRDAKSSSDFNKPILEPRLFHITEKRAYEIFNFTQTVLQFITRTNKSHILHLIGFGI